MKKYLIIGAGGTGGALGAFMAHAGKNVALIARGAHLQAMRENGLQLRHPEDSFTVSPVQAYTMEEYEDAPDVVFICVKGYSMAEVTVFLQRISHPGMIVIPLLNIYGTGGMLQPKLPECIVTDGCIYIASMIEKPGVIRMRGSIMRVVYGLRESGTPHVEEELRQVEADLKESGVRGQFSDNIRRDALLKFSYVSPQGACGLYYNCPAGSIQQPGEIRDCFIELIHEVDLLAQAMDIHFTQDIVARNLKILDDLAEDMTTSMQRDVAQKGPSEADGLISEVVRLGRRYHVAVPMYEKIEAELKKRGIIL